MFVAIRRASSREQTGGRFPAAVLEIDGGERPPVSVSCGQLDPHARRKSARRKKSGRGRLFGEFQFLCDLIRLELESL